MGETENVVRRLIDEAGGTYAEEAGIRLKDQPMPLFQLLVLAMLASKPIDAGVATKAARELFAAGLRTPRAVIDGDRQTAIKAFGRAGYARYDESSATRLSTWPRSSATNTGAICGISRRTARRIATLPSRRYSSSRASGRPVRTSSCARFRMCGPGSGPTSTTAPWLPRATWVCPHDEKE